MQREKESPRVCTRRAGLIPRLFSVAFTLLFECFLASDSSPQIPPPRTVVDRNGRVWDAVWDPRTARPYYVERSSGATSWAVDAAPLRWSDTSRARHLPRAGHALETAQARPWTHGPHVTQPQQLTRQYPPPQEPQRQHSRSPERASQARALQHQQPQQDLSAHQLQQLGQHYHPEIQSQYTSQAPRTKHEGTRPQNHERDRHEHDSPRDRHASPTETHSTVDAPCKLGPSELPPKAAKRSSAGSTVETKVQSSSDGLPDNGMPSFVNARETSVHNDAALRAQEPSKEKMETNDVEAAPVRANKTNTSSHASGKEMSHVKASNGNLVESKRLLAPSSSLFGWLLRVTQYIFNRKREKAMPSRPQRQKWRIFHYLQPFRRSSLQSASHTIVDARNASKKKRQAKFPALTPSVKRITGTPNSTAYTQRKRKFPWLFSWRQFAFKRSRTKQSPQPHVRNESNNGFSESASVTNPPKNDSIPERPQHSKQNEFDTELFTEHMLPHTGIRDNATLEQGNSIDSTEDISEMQQKINLLQRERDAALAESARQLKSIAELRQISDGAAQEAALLRERVADSDAEVENLRRNFARCEVALAAVSVSAPQKKSSADFQSNEPLENTPESPARAVLVSTTVPSPSTDCTDLRPHDEASQEHILCIKIRRTLRLLIGASALGAALALVIRFSPIYIADGTQLPFDE